MGQRKVYIDFVDGSGFIDVSDFVKYDTLSIQEVAFNDSYKAAQNTCSFSLIYDASIYTKVTSTTVNMPLRIFDLREGAVLHTESDQPILTETGMQILVETSVAVPVFTGHIPPKSSREYNGILDNTIIKLNATDNMDYMDVEVGDILYANCAVMNPSDPANSIVHKLALIAGWDTTRVSSVSIPTVILRFSPPDAKATVRTVLDVLLYEYGYALALDKADYVSPIQWNVSISSTMPEFNEDNAMLEVSISNSINKYDGVKVVYYDMNSANNMRVYRDSNCGYASDGTFSGYSIPNNTDYPPAANAIDETTGNKQIVYQEYTDDAIKYATNKAIQQKLDYNYKNYSSDFTAIISTEGHYVDRRFESPLTIVTEIFGNKKCQLLYRNTTGSPVLMYYNDVYATVWYKSAERTAIKNLVTTPTDVFSYTSTYIYSKAIGDALALAIAAQYKSGLKTYEIQSEIDYSIGSIARVVLSGEGTNAYVLIQNKSWDEAKEIYTYTCISYVATREELTSQTVSETAALNAAETYASIHSIGTPEAVQTALTDVQTILQGQIDGIVASTAPSYRGIGILAGAATAAFPGATVNNSGVITVGSSVTPNKGDWMTNYNSTNVALGMYVWSGTTWIVTNDVDYISSAAIDLCNLQVGGITISGFNTFTSAIIKTLFAQQIKLLDNGKLYSGAGNYNNTDTPLFMGADGKMSLGKQLVFTGSSLYMNGALDTDEAYLKADCQIIGQEYMKELHPLSINLVSGNITTIKSQINTLMNSYGVQLYATEDYLQDRRLYCGVTSADDANPVTMYYGGNVRICNFIDRYTQSGVVKYGIGIYYYQPFIAGNAKETGSYRTIISGNSLVPDYTGLSNILSVRYTMTNVTSYGSQYVDGSMTARRGLHQRCRGILGNKDTPFATQDDVFQFVAYLYKIRGTSVGLVYYTIACSVEHSDGYKYPGSIYMNSETSIQIVYGANTVLCTSGSTSAVPIRFIYI